MILQIARIEACIPAQGGDVVARLAPQSAHPPPCSPPPPNRLAPDDYHRFHSPLAGTITSIAWLGGELYSVKAAAINSRVNVLCENRRAVLRLETPAFGTAWLVAVGACQVGSVRLAVAAGEAVERGQELGRFRYGGSSVVLLLGAQRVRLDADLLENSARRLETLVRMGTSLGRAA